MSAARASFVPDGDARKVVLKFKYGNGKFLAPIMARYMLETLLEMNITPELITFVPMSKKRQKERGYNQAKLLADEVGFLCGLSVVDVLDKVKDVHTTNLSGEKRKEAAKDSVAIIKGARFNGQNILLIDDVFTTGATTRECARKLKSAGAGEVYVLTFATGHTI
jgi:competence protein ComFC